jgi:hypothetical protein
MSSPHQRLNQEDAQEQERHERESSVEKSYQSRWSSKKTRFIVDIPPSQPRSSHRRQMSAIPCSGSAEKESNEHNDLATGTSRGRSADGRLQRSSSKWAPPSSLGITDSPPLLPPLNRQGTEFLDANGEIQNGLSVLGSSPAVHHCNRSEQHQQSPSRAMLMNLPALSLSGHQMSPKKQREHVQSTLQLALDIMPDVDASSFESHRLVSSSSRPRNSEESSRDK